MFKEFYLFSGFYIYNQFLRNSYNEKNARNMVAFTHASGSVILNSIYLLSNCFGNPFLTNFLLNLSFNYSIGYFLYDLFYILNYDKLNFLRYCYIYHHLGAIYIINNSHLISTVPLILLTGELSNLPSYYIYHNLHLDNKTEESKKEIIKYKKIQRYLYGILRVPVMSYMMYDILVKITNSFNYIDTTYLGLFCAGFPIYLMGLGWTYLLFQDKN